MGNARSRVGKGLQAPHPPTSILALSSLPAVSECSFVGSGSQARGGHGEAEERRGISSKRKILLSKSSVTWSQFILNKHMLKVLFNSLMRTQEDIITSAKENSK